MATTMISEKSVTSIWLHQATADLETDEKKKLVVISPGRRDVDGGCDFRDAVFRLDNEMRYGNVEVHVRSGDWYRHAHHLDPKYNSVVLHVVMWDDVQSPITLQDGTRIPTVCLSRFLTDSSIETYDIAGETHYKNRYACPATETGVDRSSLYRILFKAGTRRFLEKAEQIGEDLKENRSEHTLFKFLARALGYRKNSEPFQRLAEKCFINRLNILESNDCEIIQGLLFGAAGLLPVQRRWKGCKPGEDRMIQRLETIWRDNGTGESMVEKSWCFHRIRPFNYAPRRIAAMSYLLERYHGAGLAYGMLELLPRVPDNTGFRRIEDGLAVARMGYWGIHYDFGMQLTRKSALLGREKVREMVINTLLPFIYAWSGLSREVKCKALVKKLFSTYPGTADNQLTLYMKQRLFRRTDVKLGAAQQQGLLHIFHRYCRYKNCSECTVTLPQ
jgi:hypothetical protein